MISTSTRKVSGILLILTILAAILTTPTLQAAPNPRSLLTPTTVIEIHEDGQTVYLSPITHDVWCVLDNGTIVTLDRKYFDSFFNSQGYEKYFKARKGERFGKFSEGLAPAGDKLLGFIDTTGNYAITPQYNAALEFSEGLAAVEQDGLWGYIDRTGDWVIEPLYDEARSFADGLAAVRMIDKWGFIDTQGKTVIDCKFGDVREFYDGLAAFKWINSPEEHIGYINKKGTIEIQARFDGAANFSEGMAAIRIVDLFGEKWGFINTSGQIVIKPQYNWVFPFSENLAAVDAGTETYPRWGFIDKAGNMIIKPRFGYVNSSFHNGCADVQTIKRENGLVDSNGKFTPYPPKAGWETRYSFSSRKVGYLDQNRNWAILPRFMEAGMYSEGVASVRSFSSPWKWGYIDLRGNIIIGQQFDDAAGFKNGRAMVWLNGRQGTIDHKGHFTPDKMTKKRKLPALNNAEQRMVSLLITAIKKGYQNHNGGKEYIAISFDQIALVSAKEKAAVIKELSKQSSYVFDNSDGTQINYINDANNKGTVIGCHFDSYNGTNAVVWITYSYFQGGRWTTHGSRYEATLANGTWRLQPLATP